MNPRSFERALPIAAILWLLAAIGVAIEPPVPLWVAFVLIALGAFTVGYGAWLDYETTTGGSNGQG